MNIRLQRGATDWRFLIVGLAIGMWLGLAVFLLRDEPSPAPAPCCARGNLHGSPPPSLNAFVPDGPERYYCGRSDRGGAFVWDEGGGWVWDQGGGYVWDQGIDQGGGWTWDQGGGWAWDQGGGQVWDDGGGWVWDSGARSRPLAGSAMVPVPSSAELGRDRERFEFRCVAGHLGRDDVKVVNRNDDAVVVVMNGDSECEVSDTGLPQIVPPDPPPDPPSETRAYCMVVDGTATRFEEPSWADTD